MKEKLSYSKMYYLKMKAKELGITVEEYQEMRGNSVGDMKIVEKKAISFDKVQNLSNLGINEDMLKSYKTGLILDKFVSYDEGFPVGTSMMISGIPGSGKTTIALHTLAHLQKNNKKLKCLFLSFEMSRIQLFKYTQRFPIFGCVKTLVGTDYINDNTKDVVEQILAEGYDYIVIDSIAELLESVRESTDMSQKESEKWLIDLVLKHNEGKNDRSVYSSFLLVQQVTKGGVQVGSQKVKHMLDQHLELKRDSMKDGGGLFMIFSKNRGGKSGERWSYSLENDNINYGYIIDDLEESETSDPKQFEIIVKKDSPDFQVNRNGADINFNSSNN